MGYKTPIILLGGKGRAASLLKFALDNGIRVAGISPVHLYGEEEGANEEFISAARENSLPVFDRETFGKPFCDKEKFSGCIVVCENWRRLIKEDWIKNTKGVWIFHESLLPKNRGFAPLAWHILNGENELGVTLFEAAGEMDSGDIWAQESFPIGDNDTSGDLYKKTEAVYQSLLLKGLAGFESGERPVKQNEEEATYNVPLLPDDGRLDWNETTEKIMRKIRAWTKPYSGAWSLLDGNRLHIWSARIWSRPEIITGKIPGRVVSLPGENKIRGVCASDGIIVITSASLKGEKESEWVFKNHKVTLC